MRHDKGAHQTGAYTPAGGPGIFGLVVLVQELDVKCLAEVLTQEVAGAALQSLAVLHHCLDGVGVKGTGKTLCLALHTLYNGYCHVVLGKVGIYLQHLLGTCLGLLAGSMSRMALLPQELTGTQEQTGTHFPAHYVTPLVNQQGQVAIALNPVFESIPDNRL